MQIPNAIELEKQVLSAMLIRDGEIIPTVTSILTPDDFYRPEHRTTYNAILALVAKGITPNLYSIVEELRETGKLNDAGGIEFALALGSFAYTNHFAEDHCHKIKERSIQREIIRQSELLSKYAIEGKDAAVVIKKISELDAEKNALHSGAVLQTFQNEADYYTNCAENDRNRRREFADRKTGFFNIDAVQTFAPGLWIIAALPGQGKTDFALQIADFCAANGENVLYVSLELTEGELRARCDARELYLRDPSTNLSASEIYNGAYSAALAELVEERKKSTRNFAITTIVASMENLVYEIERYCVKVKKPPVIVVDYLQCLPTNAKDRREGIGKNAYALKQLQQNTNSTIIAISSVNRTNYSSSFSLEAVKESGDIDFAADLIAGLQPYCANSYTGSPTKDRQLYADAMQEYPRKMEFKVVKNRGGRFYSAFFNYYGGHSYFEALEDDSDFQEIEGPPEIAGNHHLDDD